MRKFSVISVLLLLPALATAFGYIETMGPGTPLPGFTARGLSLGGVRSMGIGDGSAMLTNPAGLSRTEGLTLTASIGPGIGSAIATDSLGQKEYNWLSFSSLFASIAVPVTDKLVLGTATGRVTDFSYDFTHYTYEFFLGTLEITDIRDLHVSGGMYESVGAVSYRATDWLHLGASAGLRYGSANYDSTYTDNEDPDNDTTAVWKRDFNSFCWHGGLEIPLEAAIIGLSWASEDDDYPARAAVGGLLYTNESRRDAVGADVEIGDPGGTNSTVIRFFGEYYPSVKFQMRGALSFETPNYENLETGTSIGLSVGTGLTFGNIQLDSGVSWSSLGRDSLFLVEGNWDELKDSRALISFECSWRP